MSNPLIPNLTGSKDLEELKKSLLSEEGIKATFLENTEEKLAIEEKVLKETNNEKKVYSYNESLERMRKYGYERHLRPNEAFNIIIDALEFPESNYKEIYKDMMSSSGEWLSLAIERDKDSLICYLDPEFISADYKYLTRRKIKYNQKYAFDIKNIKTSDDEYNGFSLDPILERRVSLGLLPKELVCFLYTKKFDDLPEIIKNKGHLLIPDGNIIAPLSRKGVSIYLASSAEIKNASRGVKVLNKKYENFDFFP